MTPTVLTVSLDLYLRSSCAFHQPGSIFTGGTTGFAWEEEKRDTVRKSDHSLSTPVGEEMQVASLISLCAATGVLGPYAGLEPQLAYVSLLIQSCRYFSRTLNATNGDAELASNMSKIADTLTAKVRARPSSGGEPYWKDYGVHASANLLSAGVPTATERQLIAANVFNDSTSVCSYSPFNTCVWALQFG